MRALVAEAKRRLGVDRLVLAIHDASFPSTPGEDIGRGSPYGEGGEQLLRFASELGFDAIQLGPQGITSAFNPSPYDGTIFARDPLSLSVVELVEGGLVRSFEPAAGEPNRCDHARAEVIVGALLDEAWRARTPALQERVEEFVAKNASWVVPAALYELLASIHGHGDYARWRSDRELWHAPDLAAQRGALRASAARQIDRFGFAQLLLHEQHADFRRRAGGHGLAIYGDLQIGLGLRDEWAHGDALLPGYRLGAPPSRTNPAGQPWGYRVLHPAQRRPGTAAYELCRARLRKMFAVYDAVRVDHPHGLVCPWVYRDDDDDALHAVQHGARLFSSPDLPDHAELARYAIARPEQLAPERPRYDDDWVAALEPAQIDRYAALIDLAVGCAEERGLGAAALVCEVLSTRPRPLTEVTRRHGIGRFRVTQKADLEDPRDVYRAENAAPEDWVMMGTHDTATIWALTDGFAPERRLAEARHLARRLAAPEMAARWTQTGDLARAKLAELFACPARQVMIFFADLFGLRERYNRPGSVSPHNWRLRLPPDFARRYRTDIRAGEALDVTGALALALRAQGHHDLAAALVTAPVE